MLFFGLNPVSFALHRLPLPRSHCSHCSMMMMMQNEDVGSSLAGFGQAYKAYTRILSSHSQKIAKVF